MILARPIGAFFSFAKNLVKTGTITEQGREIIYDVRTDGDAVGELCALGIPRRERGVAIETTAAIVVGLEEVVATLAGNALLLSTFITELSRVLADAYEQLNRVVRGNVHVTTIDERQLICRNRTLEMACCLGRSKPKSKGERRE
jgi:CRP-like cAMP-binding protein